MAIIDKKGVLHGAVSNIVYRPYRNLQIAQMKPAKVRQTIKSKEAGLEFGLCSSTARVVREAFLSVYKGNDGRMVNRLTSAVRKAVSACTHKERGERDIHDGDLSFFRGFQFNANSPMEKALAARPSAELTPENKVRITLPAIAKRDIKGPACDEFIIRFVAISFDFKKEVYSYNSFRKIVIDHSKTYQGEEIIMDETFPPGRFLLLSMSIHGYRNDGFGQQETINSKEWSPAELIGGWHLPQEEPTEKEISVAVSDTEEEEAPTVAFSYEGSQMHKRIAKLWEKTGRPKKQTSEPQILGARKESDFELPEGDVGFKV